jgi:hypothetical protein
MQDFFGQPLIGHGAGVTVATGYFAFLPESGLGVVVMANAGGYSMANFAQFALACLMGKDLDSLPFLRIDKALAPLTGLYEGFRGTMRAEIRREGDFLRLDFLERIPVAQPITLVPERLDGPGPRFFTVAEGMRLPVTFRQVAGITELIYDRYKLRRIGPCTATEG